MNAISIAIVLALAILVLPNNRRVRALLAIASGFVLLNMFGNMWGGIVKERCIERDSIRSTLLDMGRRIDLGQTNDVSSALAAYGRRYSYPFDASDFASYMKKQLVEADLKQSRSSPSLRR